MKNHPSPDPSTPAPGTPSPVTPDSAICTAATLYLMTHYAQRPCPLVAHAIADQLARLSRNCASGSSLVQTLAAALRPRWQHIAGGSVGAAHH